MSPVFTEYISWVTYSINEIVGDFFSCNSFPISAEGRRYVPFVDLGIRFHATIGYGVVIPKHAAFLAQGNP